MTQPQKIIQNTFAGGILDELLHSRFDLTQYQNSVAESKNTVHLTQGGISNRAGSIYCNTAGNTLNPAQYIRLFTFNYSVNQQYLIVFGKTAVEIYSYDGMTKYATLVPPTALVGDTNLENLRNAQIGDVMFFFNGTQNKPAKLIRNSETSWQFSDMFDAGHIPPMTSINTKMDLGVTAVERTSGGFLYKLNFDNTFTQKDIDRYNSGKYCKIIYDVEPYNERFVVNEQSAIASPILLKAGVSINLSTTGTWNGEIRVQDEYRGKILATYSSSGDRNINVVLRFNENVRLNISAPSWTSGTCNLNVSVDSFEWEQMYYKAYPEYEYSWQQMNADGVDYYFGANNVRSTKWSFPDTYYAGVSGSAEASYPYMATMFFNRLVLFYLSDGMCKVAFSEIGNFENFNYDEILDSSPIILTLPYNMAIAKSVVKSSDKLIVIMLKGTVSLFGYNGIVSPTTITMREENNYLTVGGHSVNSDNAVFCELKDGLGSMIYNYDTDKFNIVDISLFCKKLFLGRKIKKMIYNESEENEIFILFDDGKLVICNFVPQQQFCAFYEREFDYPIVDMTDVIDVESGEKFVFAVFCYPETGYAGHFAKLLNRTHTSDIFLDHATIVNNVSYIDCSDYMFYYAAGRPVCIVTDGIVRYYDTFEGRITFDREYEKIVIGYPYTTEIKTLPYVYNVNMFINKTKLFNVYVDMYLTRGLELGESLEDMTAIADGDVEETKIVKRNLSKGFNFRQQIFLRQQLPCKMTLRSLTFTHGTGEYTL